MTLDNDELTIIRACLDRARHELVSQIDGKGQYLQVTGMSWYASRYCRSKIEALMVRVEQELEAAS